LFKKGEERMDKLHRRFKGGISGSAVAILLGLCFLGADIPFVLAEDAGNTATATTSAPAAEPSLGLLMSALDKAGLAQSLEKAGINIYGYTEAGYMYDATAPKKGPTFMGFNNLKNTPLLDKIGLTIERTVDPSKKQFDLGFRTKAIWGFDSRFIHSNGLDATQTGRYQWDPLEAYVDVALPNVPMKIRFGKWIELAGFEQFDANIYGAFGDPSRALYSYSYSFLYAEPGTQTGVLATYVLNPQWTFDAGFTRGWNQSTRDANNYLDFLGRITYIPTDKTSVIFVMTEGPEFPTGVGSNLAAGDNKHWWTALDLVVTHKVTDKLSLGTGLDFVDTPQIPGLKKGSKQWGAVDGYVSYALDPHFTMNSRLEWYNDSSNGFATGAATGASYYEATFGVAIKPFPKDKIFSNLLLRPEIRYDWSNRRVFDNRDKGHLTLCGDVLFTF